MGWFLTPVSAIIKMQVRRCYHAAALLVHGLGLDREIIFQHCFEIILGPLCCCWNVLWFAEMHSIPTHTSRQSTNQHIKNGKKWKGWWGEGGDAIESTIWSLDRGGISDFSSEIDDPHIKCLKMMFEFPTWITLFGHNAFQFLLHLHWILLHWTTIAFHCLLQPAVN